MPGNVLIRGFLEAMGGGDPNENQHQPHQGGPDHYPVGASGPIPGRTWL